MIITLNRTEAHSEGKVNSDLGATGFNTFYYCMQFHGFKSGINFLFLNSDCNFFFFFIRMLLASFGQDIS